MPTLTNYRRALGQELGGFGVYTATGGTTTTLVCASAFRSTELPADHLAYAWIYLPGVASASDPRQRRVKKDGLTPGTGTITVEDAFGAAVTAGIVFEVSARLPLTREPSAAASGVTTEMGLNECINLGLRHLLIRDDSPTLSLVNGQRDYSVSGIAYLDRASRLEDVRQLSPLGTDYVSTWRPFEFRESAAGNVLRFPKPFRFSSGSYSVKLVTLRPASTRINDADSTVGLTAESDTAEPDTNDVVTVALAYAYRALRDSRRGVDRAKYAGLYETQVQAARDLRNYDHTNDIDPLVPRTSAVSEAA